MGSTELDGTDFEFVAGFDSNVNRTEILHADFPLHPTTLLEKVVREEEIKFAILTVSASEAQQCAAKLSDAGIIGIVNYTPCVLSVPPSTAVENVSLLTALETLSAVLNRFSRKIKLKQIPFIMEEKYSKRGVR